ncbi:hypothetical protein G9A89_011159 [Geosiphon pyriformis]|nr:hypothetical protein G9A89_011159 [Geosiphon pyriformis]
MTTTRAKNKKVANSTFPIVTNKVSTQESLSVIKAAKQNVLATFLLKNISEKLSLVASGSFSSPLAGNSSPVKVSSKRHTRVSPSIVSTTSKSPKIFNNRPVNKLVFSALITPTTTTTTTSASQMAAKVKNSKKQQQAVTTARVTPNPFVVPDKILGKISTAAASSLPNMDGNSNGLTPNMKQDQPLAVLSDVVISSRLSPAMEAKQSIISDDLKDWADQMEMESSTPLPVSGVADSNAWINVNGQQRFSGWVAFILVSGVTFKIKMAFLNAVKLFCMEFVSQESLTGTTTKSKKVVNITFLIVTNKVSTREGLSVIEAARQNILATFPLKNNSNKLPLAASGSFSSSLAGSSSPVKVPSKRHTWVSPSVVSTTSKSPKIFNNRPVNMLVFPVLTTLITTSTTTASQMAAKAKNPKKQQQAVTTAMVTLNPFVVPDEIFSKISTATASPIPDMDDNNSSTSPKMSQDQPLAVLPDVVLSSRSLPIPVAKQSINPDDLKDWADQMEMESTVPPPVSGASDASAWVNVNGRQRFSGWVASNLVPGAIFKIKMALFNAVKLFCVEFASQKCLNGATKVAIGDEVFLTTLKIAQSSEVASVSSPSLSVALRDVPLGASSDDIKSALGIFGVVTSQYAVVNFKDTSSAAAALSNWSVLVRKDSVRILSIANQKEVITSRDAFKAKLVNLPFGCTAFEISNLVFQVSGHTCFIPHSPDSYQCQCFAVVTFGSLESLNAAVSKTSTLCGCCIWWETSGCHCCYRCQSLDYLAVDCKVLPSLPPKLSSNSAGGPIIFKSSLIGAKSYAKTATSVVPSVAAAADTDLAFSTSPKVVVLLLPVASSGSDVAVNAKLASLETQLSELSLLIKSIVEPVGSLVVLITKLLSTPPIMAKAMKENVVGLGNQIKAVHAVASVLQKEVGALTITYLMIKTWMMMMMMMMMMMSSLVKSSHELVCIMGKMYELDMFNTLSSKGMAIGDEVFLTTLKIAQSSGVASVSSPSLSVVLHDVPLDTSSDDIKTALSIFGVVTSVKLKPAICCG